MSYGFIDSASIMNAVSALTCHKSPEEWGEWEARSIFEVTEALFIHHLLRIAPGPSPSRSGGAKAAHSTLYACYDQACRVQRHHDDNNRCYHGLLYNKTLKKEKDGWERYSDLIDGDVGVPPRFGQPFRGLTSRTDCDRLDNRCRRAPTWHCG